ncbi:hypothetical protein E8E11_000437 [Didymella keratinophila]|nr:hypothetical protein E8E11_000437 [Didymella keratinophila]
MSAVQLTKRLLALEHDYAQYRVEMALYVDKLERRLEEAERNSSRVPLRSGPFGASYVPYQITVPRLSEHHADARAPPPFNTAPAMAPAPIFTPSFSPLARDPAHTGTPNEGIHHPVRCSGRPPKNMGSGDNAAFLPYAIEKIAVASQKKTDGDRRSCACGRPTFDIKCFRQHHFDWSALATTTATIKLSVGVKDLYELLFPIEEYPDKYENGCG